MEVFLINHLRWETHPKSGPHLVAAYMKGHRIRKVFLFALPSLLLATSSSILLLRHSLAGVRTYFFRITM